MAFPFSLRHFASSFKNGIIESASARFFRKRDEYNTSVVEMFIESFADVADNLRMQFKNFKEFEMQDPFYLIVTMIGMQGVVPSLRNGFYLDPRPIDDDFIQLPEIRLDPLGSSSIDPADILKPLLRALWNAFGLDRR